MLQYAVDCIRRTGSFEYTLNFLVEVEARARRMIDELGGSQMLMSFLDRLATVYRPAASASAASAADGN